MIESNPLSIGANAPDFSLPNQEGDIISLKKILKDSKFVLLYFYPRAMTPGCTVQACSLEASKKQFQSKDIKVLGVSPDKVESLKKFALKEKLSFDLLSDLEHKVALTYGVWGKKTFMGKTKEGIHRISFLINSKGIIVHAFYKVNTKTHHDDVLEIYKGFSTKKS